MYDKKTYENIKDNILSKILNLDKREGSFVSDIVSPIALEFDNNYRQLEKMLSIMFLDETTGEYLDKRSSEYGVVRKQGTKAIGTVVFTGVEGAKILKGSLVATGSGILFETIADVIIGIDGNISAGILSCYIGTKNNVIENTITHIPVAIFGVQSVTNLSKTQEGTDEETDTELLNRILFLIRSPATSGNSIHYKQWSMEVEGVGDAKVTPLKNGNGTVEIMPITTNKKAPEYTLLEKIKNHIESKRPIGAEVSVVAPIEVAINVAAKVVLDNSISIAVVKENYTKIFNEYITDSVFKTYTVDYFKCLSFLYDIKGVVQVTEFKLNNTTANIVVLPNQIQITGTININ